MNKKAFLLAEETLKIVVAVICIVFLAYFLTSLYFSKISGEKLKFADNALNRMEGIIKSLEEGNSSEQNVPNPSGWYILEFTSLSKPNACLGQNCICICPKAWDYKGNFDRQQKKCDKKGSCLVVEELRNIPLDIKITGTNPLLFIDISRDNGRVLISKK